MSHLSLETIARIVDDGPSAEETIHLDRCASCRAELDTMREDVHALSMLPDMAPAPDEWAALERRLADEGLLRTPQRFGLATSRYARIAAAVLLFVGGSIAGRFTAPAQSVMTAQAPAARTDAQTPPAAQMPADADVASVPDDADIAPNRDVTLASSAFGRAAEPRSLEEAAALVRQTEDLYLMAMTRYAELTTQSEAGDPVARLAALQSIVLTTQAALAQAPTDPIINGYHLTALAQRDATWRQVAANTGDRWY